MTTSTTRQLSRTELHEIAVHVFVDRDSTLSDCAARYALDTLADTLENQVTELYAVLAELPERAFDAQPDDAGGNDVWSAGRVVSHLAEMQITAMPFWEAIIGSRLTAPDNQILSAIDARLLSRKQSLATARALKVSINQLVTALLAAPDATRTAIHFVLGTVDGPGALLATCLHILDHLEQLEELGSANASH